MSDQNDNDSARAEPTLDQVVAAIARHYANRFSRWVEFDDVHQELRLYVVGVGRQHVVKWTHSGELFRIRLALQGVARQYCEAEKAERSGYRPEDVAWYAPEQLPDLVAFALDPTFDGIVGSISDGTGRKADPAEGGNLLAMVLDVRSALGGSIAWARADDFDPGTEDGMSRLVSLADRLGGEFPNSPSYQRGHRRAKSNAAAAAEIRNLETGERAYA